MCFFVDILSKFSGNRELKSRAPMYYGIGALKWRYGVEVSHGKRENDAACRAELKFVLQKL